MNSILHNLVYLLKKVLDIIKNIFLAQPTERPSSKEIIPQPIGGPSNIEKPSSAIEKSKDEIAPEALSSPTLSLNQTEKETSERGSTDDLKNEFSDNNKKPKKPYIKKPIPKLSHEPSKKDDTVSQVQSDISKNNFKHELGAALSATEKPAANLSHEQNKSEHSEHKKHIDLGKKKRKTSKQPRHKPLIVPETSPKKHTHTFLRIESPYIELNLDESKVYLVIPSQKLKLDCSSPEPKLLRFEVEINGCNHYFDLQLKKTDSGLFFSDRHFFELLDPLKEINIRYPPELDERDFTYFHKNDIIYAFEPINNNLAKFYYQIDPHKLPSKKLWILLKEGYELEPAPEIIEETSIWQSYKPICIDLKSGKLKIKKPKTNEVLSFNAVQFLFNLEGDSLVEDNFKYHMPLFSGNYIQIIKVDSSQLESQFDVWIQNRLSGYRKFTRKFDANNISFSLPADLPCEAGEFQIDIRSQNVANPPNNSYTLFFRFIPHFLLDYCKTLIIPDPRKGHKYEFIKVVLDNSDWQLINNDDLEIEKNQLGYMIKLPSNKDSVFFSFEKTGKPETNTNIWVTVPRLKWRISDNYEWSDKLIKIMKKDLSSGTDLHLIVCTNDPFNKYEISGLLMVGNKILQEIRPDLKGTCYYFLLNELFDTIKSVKKNSELRIKIFKNETKLGELVIITFISEKIETKLPLKKRNGEIPNLWPVVTGGNKKERRGKGFSKDEICLAGLTEEDVIRLGISIDKRRKSKHFKNIEILKSHKELKKNGY